MQLCEHKHVHKLLTTRNSIFFLQLISNFNLSDSNNIFPEELRYQNFLCTLETFSSIFPWVVLAISVQTSLLSTSINLKLLPLKNQHLLYSKMRCVHNLFYSTASAFIHDFEEDFSSTWEKNTHV